MNRRKFLRATGILSTSAVIAIGLHGWAAKSTPLKNNSNPKRLIVIFLRGAVDGLNVVIPHWESAYYDVRPLIAIAPPNEADGALDLDGRSAQWSKN